MSIFLDKILMNNQILTAISLNTYNRLISRRIRPLKSLNSCGIVPVKAFDDRSMTSKMAGVIEQSEEIK